MARVARRTVVAGIAGAGVAGIGGRVFGASVLTGGANAPDAELLDLFAEWRALAAESVQRDRQTTELLAPALERFASWRSPADMPDVVRAEYDALWARVDREVETEDATSARCERLCELERAIAKRPASSAIGVFVHAAVLIWCESRGWADEDWSEPDRAMTLMRTLWGDIERQAPELHLAGLLEP